MVAVLETIRKAGIQVTSGEHPEAREIAKKIRERINESDLFVAIMTRRHHLAAKHSWTTGAWVIEEKGYSLGQNANRPVIALVEEGVEVPTETGGLEGDLEVLFFNRTQFDFTKNKLRQVLIGIISNAAK